MPSSGFASSSNDTGSAKKRKGARNPGPRHPSPVPFPLCSVAVLVEISGQRPLDAVPGIARRVSGPVPAQLRAVLTLLPVATELGLDVRKLAVGIARIGLPAVLIRRLEHLVGLAGEVGALRVGLAPLGVFD